MRQQSDDHCLTGAAKYVGSLNCKGSTVSLIIEDMTDQQAHAKEREKGGRKELTFQIYEDAES
jgi:hypothetical protein